MVGGLSNTSVMMVKLSLHPKSLKKNPKNKKLLLQCSMACEVTPHQHDKYVLLASTFYKTSPSCFVASSNTCSTLERTMPSFYSASSNPCFLLFSSTHIFFDEKKTNSKTQINQTRCEQITCQNQSSVAGFASYLDLLLYFLKIWLRHRNISWL